MRKFGIIHMGGWVSFVIIALIGFAELASANDLSETKTGAKLTIYAAIAPQAWLLENIMQGIDADIHIFLPAGKSPATYDPTPREMASLCEADIYFTIGLPFEGALLAKLKKAAPELKIFDCTIGIKRRSISDNPGNRKHNSGLDPHIWLNPLNAKTMANNMTAQLSSVRPEYSETLQKNLAILNEKLDKLDKQIEDLLGPYKGDTILIFHPAYGYFTDRYGLVQLAIELDGHEPSGRYLADIIDVARRQKIRVIFVQSEFSDKSARAIAGEINCELITVNPLAEEYDKNLYSMAQAIAGALKGNN